MVVQTLAEATGLSALAAARPALAFFLVQLGTGIAARLDWISVPPALAWLVSFVAIGAGLFFAILEFVAFHQEDLAELLDDLYITRLAGALSAFTSSLLLAVSGAPMAEVNASMPVLEPGSAEHGMIEALQLAQASEAPLWLQVASVGTAVVVNLAFGWLRARVVRVIRDAAMGGWWSWIESGGVLAFFLLLPFLPVLLALLLVLTAVVAGALLLAFRFGSVVVDRRHRRPCPACQTSIREEALVCYDCGASVLPVVHLEPRLLGPPKRRREVAVSVEV